MTTYNVTSNQYVVAQADNDTYNVSGSNNTINAGPYTTTVDVTQFSTNTVDVQLGGSKTVSISTGLWPQGGMTTIELYGINQASLNYYLTKQVDYARQDLSVINFGGTYIGFNPGVVSFVANPEPPATNSEVTVYDTTLGITTTPTYAPYVGPVAGLTSEYIDIATDNINITATSPNMFLRSGSGMDALAVTSGNNILDGSTGSNFLTGGTGNDTFYMDDRQPAAPIFSTIANFHAGDNATVWGVNLTDFTETVLNNQGAAGFTGVDLIFSKTWQADTSFVLAGYTSADLSNGRLTMTAGTTGDLPGLPGSQYITLHAN